MDYLALQDTTTSAADKSAQSNERWAIVRDSITQLTSAKSTAELTSIIGAEGVQVVELGATEATATATPVPTSP